MLFTVDTLYILTTQKKGKQLTCAIFDSLVIDRLAAKHLEQLKGGRFPIEVLVRGKDAAENEKLFIQITDKIKAAGVRNRFEHLRLSLLTRAVSGQSRNHRQRYV
jgi:hypothetical protein